MVCLTPELSILMVAWFREQCPEGCQPVAGVSFQLDGVRPETYFAEVPLQRRRLIVRRSPEFVVIDEMYVFEKNKNLTFEVILVKRNIVR
jgi:hypothetical protein